MRSILLVVSACLLGACLLAASFPVSLVAEEENIVITGDRWERPIGDAVTKTEVLSRKRIVESGAENAAQALENHPGLEVVSGIRGRSVRIQGLDPRYVLILVDGERLAGRVNEAVDLTRIKVEEIERIEIVKGASSALYGSDAVGGVINIITRIPRKPGEFEVSSSYGSGRRNQFGSGGESNASLFAGNTGPSAANSFTGGWHRCDGYDLTPMNQIDRLLSELPTEDGDKLKQHRATTGSAVRDLNVSDRLRWMLSDQFSLTGRLSYRYLDQEKIETSPPRQVIERRNRTHEGSGSIAPVYKFPGGGSIQGLYYYTRYQDRLDQNQVGSDELDRSETQDDRLQEFRAEGHARLTPSHFVTLGSDGMIEELISPRIKQHYAVRHRTAFFIQDEWSLWDKRKLILVPGLRHEEDGDFGVQTTPRLALRFDPAGTVRIRAGAGAGFRAPSFKDQFLSFQNPGVGYQVRGNPDLKPERSTSTNAGIEWEGPRHSWFSLSVYQNRITNLIAYAKSPAVEGDLATYEPRNFKEAYTRGAEAMVDFRPLSAFDVAFGYALTESRDVEQGIDLEGRARHRFQYRFEWHPVSDFSVSIQGAVRSRQAVWYAKPYLYSLDSRGKLNTNQNALWEAFARQEELNLFEPNPEFPRQGVKYRNTSHLLDLRLRARVLETLELFAGVENILDDTEVDLDPRRPRFFYAGIRASFSAVARGDEKRRLPAFESSRPLDLID